MQNIYMYKQDPGRARQKIKKDHKKTSRNHVQALFAGLVHVKVNYFVSKKVQTDTFPVRLRRERRGISPCRQPQEGRSPRSFKSYVTSPLQ